MDLEESLSNVIISQLENQPIYFVEIFSIVNQDVIQYHNKYGSLSNEALDDAMENVIIKQARSDKKCLTHNPESYAYLLSTGGEKPLPAERQACLAYAMNKGELSDMKPYFKMHGTDPEEFLRQFFDKNFPSNLRNALLNPEKPLSVEYPHLDISKYLVGTIINSKERDPKVIGFYTNREILEPGLAK